MDFSVATTLSDNVVAGQRRDLVVRTLQVGEETVLPQPEGSPRGNGSLTWDLRWLAALRDGLGHTPYLIEAHSGGRPAGCLALSLVSSRLFGRYLVSLPYLNSGGVSTDDPQVAAALVDRAVMLADALRVKHLELRHEQELAHPALTQKLTSKAHMRLPLPATADELWSGFKPKVRNQIRKGEQQGFEIVWGGMELLNDFYRVFSENMRDLGTPVFGKSLFRSILTHFPRESELCVLRLHARPVAAAVLMHGPTITEVPSASSLRSHNSANANMLMYWQLLQRAVERGQATFDFGRSSSDSGTYRFKSQWGARPTPAVWQYYVRSGAAEAMRRESGKYDLLIRAWRRLPLGVSRVLGPMIVRGIP